MAFVGSAACGIVLMAGAAAHADEPDATEVVSTTIQSVSTSTVSVADPTIDAVASTVQDTVEAVSTSVDDAKDTVSTVVDDAKDAVSTVVVDAKDAVSTVVDDVVEELPVDPVTIVVKDPVRSVDAASPVEDTSIAVPPEAIAPPSTRHHTARSGAEERRTIAALAFGRSTMLDAAEPAGRAASTDPVGSSTGHPAAPAAPAVPTGRPMPALPLDPGVKAFGLALIGVILLRLTLAPPLAWRRHAPPATPFHGVAVALAVQRPG